MILSELFNKEAKLEVTRDRDNDFEVETKIGSKTLVISALRERGYPWEVAFYRKDGARFMFRMTGDGGEFEVMSAVKQFMQMFIQKHQPKTFDFTAKEESRVGVYERMLKRLLPSPYKFTKTEMENGETRFVVSRG